jgi:hypothetical protein
MANENAHEKKEGGRKIHAIILMTSSHSWTLGSDREPGQTPASQLDEVVEVAEIYTSSRRQKRRSWCGVAIEERKPKQG